MTQEEIAAFVYRKRANKLISLNGLARRSGIPNSSISRFERGLQSMQLNNIIDLLDALGYRLEIVEKERSHV